MRRDRSLTHGCSSDNGTDPVDEDIPYLLLTPGPITTSRSVREAMLRDYCTWDSDYNELVSDARGRVVRLVTRSAGDFTSVFIQGSGTFAVESVVGSVIPPGGKLLVVENGAYGKRIAQIARRLRIECVSVELPETEPADPVAIEATLRDDASITHLAMVHCETTTGLLNPAAEVGQVAAHFGKSYILDAISSLGGIPITVEELHADYLIGSANKCLQGVPGFAFVVARAERLRGAAGWARSLSLDLHDQWREMEENRGKWRYTSPTHAVRAFCQALDELSAEGGIGKRNQRYCENHRLLVSGMRHVGFQTLIADDAQSPIITAFRYPDDPRFEFEAFYQKLKSRRFVLYPGKVTGADTFRIGTIGHVFPEDITALVDAVIEVVKEMRLQL